MPEAPPAEPSSQASSPAGTRRRLLRREATIRPRGQTPSGLLVHGTAAGFVGRRLGQYRLLEPIAEGSRGTIYAALDVPLRRRVAVKIVHPELLTGSSLTDVASAARRFAREIRRAARLQHPHCVPIHNLGRQGSLLYVVMPLIEGCSVQERLDRQGGFSLREATRIAEAAARGLAAAHDRGLIHGDVKPRHVLLGPLGEVRLIDWGWARAAETALADLTDPLRWLGSPHYFSPELCRGERLRDPRSDVYSLAATYFAMLTGRPLFGGEPTLAVLEAHRHRRPPDLRGVLSFEGAPNVGPAITHIGDAIAGVLARALAKRPEDRFASAAEFAESLAEIGCSLHAMVDRPAEPTEHVSTVAESATESTALPDQPPPLTPDSSRELPLEFRPSPTASLGQRLGDCLLSELIAVEGGTQMCRAFHQRFARQVLVRVADRDRPSAPQHFQQWLNGSARRLLRLSHPNLVRVLEIDVGDAPHLVIESVDGFTLSELIETTGGLHTTRALEIAKLVCEGLAYAAELDVLHGDLQPDRILISRDGQIKVADIGLPPWLAENQPQADASSECGELTNGELGTPGFAAPELRGSTPSPPSVRSDIYSLGVTLFAMLSGRAPFVDADPERLRERQLSGRVPELSAFVPGLDREVSALVRWMMLPRPQTRPASYQEVLAELNRLLTRLGRAR